MANKFRIEVKPHKNKDGTLSPSKKDYVVVHSPRNGSRVQTPFSRRRDAEDYIAVERNRLIESHLSRHPNDKFFQHKHKIGEK